MVFLRVLSHKREGGKSRRSGRAVISHALSGENAREVMAMVSRAIWRVWYGITSFEGAVSFAAFVEADRIEVVRDVAPLPAAELAA
jgi:hypothetical protein